ncbi:MAG: UDP-N-acetylglucosamine 2-epimerase (non-hydrolyzing) [Deltaproteobacteria bacterium]|nr:UDP-N-acetylglucosamine 2-epimerase (non-hydrolyzing) [Deltaproteobacteria bacterium]
MTRRVLVVCGTRPEAIKVAPVVLALQEHPDFEARLCATAQHRQMLDQVLEIFELVPDHDLDVMTPGQDLFGVTAAVLQGMKGVLEAERPDVVLVQGDTTTAFAAGLAAFYLKIPLGHIEAGLRTHQKYSPFPEEKSRHMLGTLADFHFPPTEASRANLLRENVPAERIWVTGNTVIDALKRVSARLEGEGEDARWRAHLRERFGLALPPEGERILLVTGHRRENFGEGIARICAALKSLAAAHADLQIVYPVHPNPRVIEPVRALLAGQPNIHLIEPLDYTPFLFLMKNAHLVLTDSGGIQEEAPSLGKPVLVMRDTTERPEGVEAGTVKLVGTSTEAIVEGTEALLRDPAAYEAMARTENPYGDGKASARILEALLTAFG